ncbi:hypothetical protein BH11ARM2_BH11ARM2_13540 [soil metagenome]
MEASPPSKDAENHVSCDQRRGRTKNFTDVHIENPISNSPFQEPSRHFRFSDEGITNEVVDSHRVSSDFIPIPLAEKKGGQKSFETEWTQDRRRLLLHGNDPEHEKKLSFCQIVALETATYIAGCGGKCPSPTSWPTQTPGSRRWRRLLEDTTKILPHTKNQSLGFTIPYAINEVTGKKDRDKKAKASICKDLWVPTVTNRLCISQCSYLEIPAPRNANAEILEHLLSLK